MNNKNIKILRNYIKKAYKIIKQNTKHKEYNDTSSHTQYLM